MVLKQMKSPDSGGEIAVASCRRSDILYKQGAIKIYTYYKRKILSHMLS